MPRETGRSASASFPAPAGRCRALPGGPAESTRVTRTPAPGRHASGVPKTTPPPRQAAGWMGVRRQVGSRYIKGVMTSLPGRMLHPGLLLRVQVSAFFRCHQDRAALSGCSVCTWDSAPIGRCRLFCTVIGSLVPPAMRSGSSAWTEIAGSPEFKRAWKYPQILRWGLAVEPLPRSGGANVALRL